MVRISNNRRNARPGSGFTLVEMLVVAAILSLMAASIISAVAGAQEQAREARTRAQITRLNALLAPRWEAYYTRRVPIRIPDNVDRVTADDIRLIALHDLMRMEMPERITDITDPPYVDRRLDVSLKPPALWRSYNRTLARRTTQNNKNQTAECLYMIVAAISDGNSTGLSFFSEREIGDTDKDGLPEILDGWGTPIRFLRWAPAFVSPLQPASNRDPDPFDPQSDGGTTFALYPLIISAGPDKLFDIGFFSTSGGSIRYRDIKSNPFDQTVVRILGQVTDGSGPGEGEDNSLDNIHNHVLGGN